MKNINANFQIIGMAEWFVPAIVSYQAIHNNFSKSKIERKKPTTEILKYLSSKPLSIDSKKPVDPSYWKRLKEEQLRLIYSAVKMSEEEGNIFDVRTLHKRKLSDVDLLTYSFPCQDLSQQGKQRGMSKNSGTRSGLLWEIEKALVATPKSKLPNYLLMENVMSITFSNNKKELDKWLAKLESLGYKNDLKILNSANFGSSQARRRAFMISSLRKKCELPIGTKKPEDLRSILGPSKETDFLEKLQSFSLTPYKKTGSNINKRKLEDYTTFNSEAYVYDPKHTGPTLTASGANSRIKMLFANNQIRKMNAKEAFRYMGFETEDYQRVYKLDFLTESKMIYTCGNSISIEVLEAIFGGISW